MITVLAVHLRKVLNRRTEQFNLIIRLKKSWGHLCWTSWRCLQNVLKTSWSYLEDVLNTCRKRLKDILKTSWRRFYKTSWRRLEDIWSRLIYWSWSRRPKYVSKMSSGEVWLRQIYSSWSRRCLLKTKTKDVFKTSTRCIPQNECLLGYFTFLHNQATF